MSPLVPGDYLIAFLFKMPIPKHGRPGITEDERQVYHSWQKSEHSHLNISTETRFGSKAGIFLCRLLKSNRILNQICATCVNTALAAAFSRNASLQSSFMVWYSPPHSCLSKSLSRECLQCSELVFGVYLKSYGQSWSKIGCHRSSSIFNHYSRHNWMLVALLAGRPGQQTS